MRVQDVLTALERWAPASTAEEWDNVGLLAGDGEALVSGIVVTLDVTEEAQRFAGLHGANLLVSHHPLIFHPLRRLTSGGAAYRLAAAGMHTIAMHTNLDKAAGGVNDVLASLLGLCDVHTLSDGLFRIGRLPQRMEADAFASLVSERLETAVRYARGTRGGIQTVGVCGGAGGDGMDTVLKQADAFVTGELRHHEWLEAVGSGAAVIEAGHYATEAPVVNAVADRLQKLFPEAKVFAYTGRCPYHTTGTDRADD